MRSEERLENGIPVAAPEREPDWLRKRLAFIPRPFRFIGVGGFCLLVDLGIFTAIPTHTEHPLVARIVSISCATAVAWRLNRAFTFDATGRAQHEEAIRYAVVTAVAQGTSYAIFTALVLSVFGWLPQAALICGAAVGAIVSYAGHRFFAFAPLNSSQSGNRA